MDAIRTISAGLENTQQNARVAQAGTLQREREDAQQPSLRPERAQPSVQVSLSEEARAAARSASPPTAPVNAPAAPVQTQEAVARAGSVGNTDRVERQDAAAQAVQRYIENANNRLPAGQSAPSSVRVSA
ncbi:MAG: hypothetical protein FWH56_03820 [Betaproteobacteria bacterium]|nr:hypothetical protein [Betaproteobacteria bacterium]